MSRLAKSAFILFTSASLMIAAGGTGPGAFAQEKENVETPRIVTVDGVKLNAAFYPSSKKNSPTVIMLHPIGDGKNIRSAPWKDLAAKLQKADYSVMMFDFRGHGDSTTIDDTQLFDMYPPNRLVRRKQKETIEYRDYKASASSYLPILINDIAAVKAYLDRRNDAGACNTSSTIVIGAEQGATLGAIWINSEWHRFRFSQPNMFMPPEFEKRAQGKDVIALISLIAEPKIGTRAVSLSRILSTACKEHGMANLVFFGKDDSKAKAIAKSLEGALKPTKSSAKHKFIGIYPLDTKLTSGVPLLQVPVDDKTTTKDLIVTFLEKVVSDRGNEWIDRDAQNALFMWKRSPVNMIPAKMLKGEKNLNFLDYGMFAQ